MPATTKKHPDQPAGRTSFEFLQEAISDIDKARLAVQGDANAQLDRTADRLRKLAAGMRTRAEEELHDLESSMDRAGESLRVEFGVRAIHAQTTPDALTRLAKALHEREAELASG
jgi:hypothetical protein